MSESVNEILGRLPEDRQITPAVAETLDKLIRDGADINSLQRETILGVVKFCVENNIPPPPTLESFCAYAYTEWTEEAKTSEEEKRNLGQLVRQLKGNAPVANHVAKLAQDVVQKREGRRAALKRMAEAMIQSAAGGADRKKDRTAGEPSKVWVRRMQEARLGFGENPMPNLNLAVQIAEEALDAYPNNPLVLFEAAGCYQILAEKSPRLSPTERYVNLRQAHALYQRCYDALTAEPYSKLKGEYDTWRAGTAKLIVKIHRDLEKLQVKGAD